MSTPPITPSQVSAPSIRPPEAQGFLGGVYDVVGPQLAAAQEDERKQRLAEQDFYFQRLHDPNLSAQPGDSPEVADTKRRQLQVALDEYTKRSPKQAKPLVQTLGQLLTHLHGHGPQGTTATGAPGSANPVGPGAQAGPPAGAMATPPFLPPGTASATPQAAGTKGGGASASAAPAIPPPPSASASAAASPITQAGPAIPPPPNAADMMATSRAGQTSFDLATKNTAEKNQLAAVLASHQQGELAEPGIIRQQLDEIAKLPQEQQLPAMMKLGMFPASLMHPVTKLVPNDPSNPAAGGHYESFSPLMGLLGGQEPAGFISPGWAGTQKSGASQYNADTGVTASSSATKKVLSGVGSGAKPTGRPAAIPAPPGGGGGQARSTSSATVSPGGRLSAMSDDWEQNGIAPSAKDKPQVEAFMRKQGRIPPAVLTGPAQTVMMKTQPVLDQVNGLLKHIDDLKLGDNNTRGYLFLPRLNYATGGASEEGTLGQDIAGLSLGSVVEAASALQGSSRSIQALKIALDHTPNAWIDSPKLMKDKLQTIKARLQDVMDDAQKFGRKNLPAGNVAARPGSIPPPPKGSPRTAEEYLQSIHAQ